MLNKGQVLELNLGLVHIPDFRLFLDYLVKFASAKFAFPREHPFKFQFPPIDNEEFFYGGQEPG